MTVMQYTHTMVSEWGLGRIAVVTGASSGIGEASARRLAADGFSVLAGARRRERIEALATEVPGVHSATLDVTDEASTEAFAQLVPRCDVLVCNAGGALGLDPIATADDEQWRTMWETNVLGVVRTVRAFLSTLRAADDGRVVVVTSPAGHEVYRRGAGYTSAKHAAVAVADTLRLELLPEGIHVTEVSPGVVQTEFSLVRFGGDEARARAVYEGVEPLTAADVADAIAYAVTRPSRITISRIDVLPRQQAAAQEFHRA
jgi:NADP-dependent 3-hydroxy acid dehydrogenase YdfG